MSTRSRSIEELVMLLVPETRRNITLRQELIDHCGGILLSSRPGQHDYPGLSLIADSIKRQLLQTGAHGTSAALKFTNLLSRLADQPVLTRRNACIQFLQLLSPITSAASTATASTLPQITNLNIGGSALQRASSSSSSLSPSLMSNSNPKFGSMGARSGGGAAQAHAGAVAAAVAGRSKAALLRDYRARIGQAHIPESLLLRDTLYLLQGISGKYIRLSLEDESEDGIGKLVFVNDLNANATTQPDNNPFAPRAPTPVPAPTHAHHIPAPTKALLHRLSEIGYLYARVESYVREREHAKNVGMIEQSLCHHLQAQLTEYYRLIAVLESQMSHASPAEPRRRTSGGAGNGASAEAVAEGQRERDREEESGLTLRRLDVWINDWRLRMRMMSVCVEGARESHGGALVNLIHGYTDNGDPFVRKFTDQLLEEVSKPFFATLHKWLFSGELYDPFLEFFVAVDTSLSHLQYAPGAGIGLGFGDGGFGGGGFGGGAFGGGGTDGGDADDGGGGGMRESGLRLWENKYRLQKDMLPMFVGEAFGKKIFSTGRSLNFIRYSCNDSDWVATREKMSNTGGILKYNDISGLERSIDAAYQIASQRLFEIFIDKFKLLDHLEALKNYLMLCHGDFAEQLMDALGPNLSKSANTLYRHNLTATLESAIRASNAQNDPPDVLRRLDARMMEYSHGEIGWDVFTLEYKVDAPLDTVLDPEGMGKYLKVFRHLWSMKRIEVALNQGWMRIAGAARTLKLPDLEYTWHKIRMTMAEMIHFIRQLQAYSHLEVIECKWNDLIEFFVCKEGDLDAMIEAHRNYLDSIVKKVLLMSSRVRREEAALREVQELFELVLGYTTTVEDFFNYCLFESARRDQEKDEARGVYTKASGIATSSRPRSGSSASTRARSSSAPGAPLSSVSADQYSNPKHLQSLLKLLDAQRQQFSEKVHHLATAALAAHEDLDCKFLGIRLSFSEFYKRDKGVGGGGEKEKEKEKEKEGREGKEGKERERDKEVGSSAKERGAEREGKSKGKARRSTITEANAGVGERVEKEKERERRPPSSVASSVAISRVPSSKGSKA